VVPSSMVGRFAAQQPPSLIGNVSIAYLSGDPGCTRDTIQDLSDGRFGVVMGILAYYKKSRVRFPHNANICVHEHVFSVGSGCIYV
jgi:hypothetical protein